MNHTVRLAGFVTRAIGLTLDAAIATLASLVIGGAVALALSLFGVHNVDQKLASVLAAGGWVVGVTAYFSIFWKLTGQTPGMRFMGIRVIDRRGGPVHSLQALRRVAGMFLAAIPLGAGFLLVLVDNRRRGLQDMIGSTLVVHTGEVPVEPDSEAALLAAGTEPSPLESAPPVPRLN